MENLIFKVAETEKEFDAYFEHLARLLTERNGINGFPHFTPRMVVPDKMDFLEKFKSELKKPCSERINQVFVALDNNTKVVAHCVLQFHGIESLKHRRHINGFGVCPDHTGQGIAKKILTEVVNLCKSIQVEYLDLELFATNTPAFELYKKVGFEQTGYTKDIARIGELSLDDVSMSLKIENFK
ncbi:MAG: GNAT family N-acetyltransferase [Bdellovibrionota bacterium]|nr:GNAT family N-acetyltransferase [Bdellovibrionota bacterium]